MGVKGRCMAPILSNIGLELDFNVSGELLLNQTTDWGMKISRAVAL